MLKLDLDTALLRIGDDAIQLTPICFSMLKYFVQHPNRLISKQELLDQIWADVVVEEGELEVERLSSLKSGDADVMVETGHCLYILGQHAAGIALIEDAVQLNPLFPDSYKRWLGIGYYRAKRYRDADSTLRSIKLDSWGYGWLAAAFARLGESELATTALENFVIHRKTELASAAIAIESTGDLLGNYQDNFRHQSEWLHFVHGLKMAGLDS